MRSTGEPRASLSASLILRGAAGLPSGPIHQHNRMGLSGDVAADLVEMHLHGLRVRPRQHERRPLWHGALIASLRALFAYLRTLLAGISEKARRADERTRVLWVGSKQWLQPCGSALFDHKLCVQRSGGFDGFQNIYQIARRHAERVKPFHDL